MKSHPLEAYLDIETTGLSPAYHDITVVGVGLDDGVDPRFVQLVGEDITADSLMDALQGVGRLYTYNGSRFDLPFIQTRLSLDLMRLFPHCDLMFNCWRQNLYGGLKNVERCLGIERRMVGIDGYEAVRLWWKYVRDFDELALEALLKYNREDVMNLITLKERLLALPS